MKPSHAGDLEDQTSFSPIIIVSVIVAIVFVLLLAIAMSMNGKQSGQNGNGPTGSGSSENGVVDAGVLGGEAMANATQKGSGDSSETSDSTAKGEGDTDNEAITESNSKVVASTESELEMDSSVEQEPEEAEKPTEFVLPLVKGPRKVNPSAISSATGNQGGSVNPFEKGAEGKDVVFIIDKSSSMMGSPFDRTRQALKDAIDSLKPKQRFTVVFFDDAHYFCPKVKGLLDASQGNKKIIKDWIDSAIPGGGTIPDSAIMESMDLNPQKIILLSDGDFSPFTVEAVTEANRARNFPIAIDCVGLSENIITLQALAHQNHGVYYQAK